MLAATLAIAALAGWLLLLARLLRLLHLLQMEHYEAARLRVWVARRGERFVPAELGGLAVGAFCAGDAYLVLHALGPAIGALVALAAAWYLRRAWRRPQVKPLVFTTRAKRLYTLSAVLAAAALAGAALAPGPYGTRFADVAVLAAVLHVLGPELLALALWLLAPLQRFDNERFVRRARRRLAEIDPLVVGITGSYGKTTTKACAAAVTELLGPSCPTPASFNSYLGVVRAINEELRPEHRSFIVEMGAYRPGDIAELCGLVRPKIGILTSIGAMHLERFGTLEAIAETKAELGRSLPADGTLITRADEELCRKAASGLECATVFFSPEPHPDASVWAEEVGPDRGGTRFVLCAAGGERANVRAKLLGAHNVANLLAAAALGRTLALPLGEIAAALGRVRPPAHRLASIVNPQTGLVVIDDAYNSNPRGFAAALQVLSAHPAERRILVTPGMVELGELQEAENHRVGQAAAAVCDVVVLTGGRNAQPVRAGLREAGFPEELIYETEGSGGAQRVLAEIARRGDVILFENDLPDAYFGGA